MPEWPHPILRLSRRCVCKSLSILRYHCRCFLSTMTFYQRISTLYRGRCWSWNVIINDLSPDSTTTSHRGTHVHFIVLFDLLHTLRYEFSPTLVCIWYCAVGLFYRLLLSPTALILVCSLLVSTYYWLYDGEWKTWRFVRRRVEVSGTVKSFF